LSQEWRDSQKRRIDLRLEKILAHVQKLKREIDSGKIAGEEGRVWLEQFCEGYGAQICAGDFVIADSIGIDTDVRKLGLDLWAYADRFVGDLQPLDYVVTNYLEAFPDTLRFLYEWAFRMKSGGIFATVCRDAEAYDEPEGPLANPRRVSCFTIVSLRCYLERAGFEVFQWENFGRELRVAARRR
jgi:hypothetical protein